MAFRWTLVGNESLRYPDLSMKTAMINECATRVNDTTMTREHTYDVVELEDTIL